MSERENEWKQLFEKNGWLKGNQIVAPNGYNLTIYGNSWSATVESREYGSSFSRKVESHGAVLKITNSPEDTRFSLWQDIEQVFLQLLS